MTTKLIDKMFSSIQNAQLAKKTVIFQKKSNLCFSVLNILWNEGIILGFKIALFSKSHYEIYLKLNFNQRLLIFSKVKSLNRLNNQNSFTLKQISKFNLITEVLILSTSRGLLTDMNCKKYNLGGKPFFFFK